MQRKTSESITCLFRSLNNQIIRKGGERLKYQFLISYFELEVFVAASVKNFQMMEEELLENRIKDYQKNAQKQTTLFYWEMDGEGKEDRDIYHKKRPTPDNAYLLYSEELESEKLVEAEKEAIRIAEKFGTNGFQFMQKNQEIAVFVKLKGNWFWLPLMDLSKVPDFQSPLLSFSKINEGEQFFSSLLKT
ncbi:hypothetical protein KGA34_002745 [Enterococcus faecalis]|nr:hypothetical protein [Enterococcus faecalis]